MTATIDPSLQALAPVDVLRAHGKSFHFASRMLEPRIRDACATLYAFCRRVDDLADEASHPEAAREQLAQVRDHLHLGNSNDPATMAFFRLVDETGLQLDPAIELIKGVEGDLQLVRVQHDAELIRYGYRVAGSVGLMMAHLLGATDSRAPAHAIDLGIAMQLTNIARDVVEDGENGRRYLPATRVGDLHPLLCANPTPQAQVHLKTGIRSILAMAEEYYASGIAGLRYLPRQSASAIFVAASVYRAIGHRILRADADVWSTRHHVPLLSKIGIASRSLPGFLAKRYCDVPEHDSDLHGYIADLPGSDESSSLVAV